MPGFNFHSFPIAALIGGRMAAVSICNCIEQNGAATSLKNFFFSQDCIRNSHRIVSINTLGVHLFRIQSGTYTSKCSKSHCFAKCLPAHAVEIVIKIDNQGQTASMFFVPQLFILTHCRKTHPFPNRATTGSSVTYIADYYA